MRIAAILEENPIPKQEGGDSTTRKRSAFDIVALATSAGGLHALSRLLSSLPDDFPATIVILQHLDLPHRSLMADLLSR